MNPLTLQASLLSFQPLLLERHYGGGAEGVGILIQLVVGALASVAILMLFIKLGHQANEVYGESFHKFLNAAGIIAVLFLVVYTLSSIGSN
jgi:chromate transport protein ChrA